MRACGTCTACCHVAAISDFKEGFTDCEHQQPDPAGSCAIFERPERPEICSAFQCSWLRGFGLEEWRPDKVGALLTVNETGPGRAVAFLGELVPRAALDSARDLTVAFARHNDLPIIVVANGEDNGGRWIIVRDELVGRAQAILGDPYARLADDVGMYERREPSGSLHG